jgi:hypothetical protein
MRKLGKVARLGLAGLMALPLSLGGCMSMQPVRDQQGNVIVDQYGNPMYRPQFDAGKTARVVGGGILGTVAGAHHAGKIVDYDAANKAALIGRGMEVIGRSGEREQRAYNSEYYYETLTNVPQQPQFAFAEPPRPIFSPQVPTAGERFFTCNRWVDSNGNGIAEAELGEFVGFKSKFGRSERVEIKAILICQNEGQRIYSKLEREGVVCCEWNILSAGYNPQVVSTAWEKGLGREGLYTATWFVDGEFRGKTEFVVE